MVAVRAPSCASWRAPRVGVEIFGMLAAKPGDVADGAVCEQLAGELAGGRADVVEADHVRRPLASAAATMACILQRGAQRLFAEHRLASEKAASAMARWVDLRRGDDDRLDLGIFHEFLPVRPRGRSRRHRDSFSAEACLHATMDSSRGRNAVSNTAPTADMATAWALPM
jgi:hypothetical protein